MRTITRSDVADTLYQEIGLSRKVSEEILDMILTEISEELADGNSVKISSFGTFLVRNKNPRIGRNPKTGVDAIISARKVISFKPSQIMKNNINKK